MMPRLHELTEEIEATTDEMLAACDAFRAEVVARRHRAQRSTADCSKAEWTLLRKLDRLWAKRRSAMREQRELLELREPAEARAEPVSAQAQEHAAVAA